MDASEAILQRYEIVADVALYFLVFAAAAGTAFSKSFPGREGFPRNQPQDRRSGFRLEEGSDEGADGQ
jgi:hypothetical protein